MQSSHNLLLHQNGLNCLRFRKASAKLPNDHSVIQNDKRIYQGAGSGWGWAVHNKLCGSEDRIQCHLKRNQPWAHPRPAACTSGGCLRLDHWTNRPLSIATTPDRLLSAPGEKLASALTLRLNWPRKNKLVLGSTGPERYRHTWWHNCTTFRRAGKDLKSPTHAEMSGRLLCEAHSRAPTSCCPL